MGNKKINFVQKRQFIKIFIINESRIELTIGLPIFNEEKKVGKSVGRSIFTKLQKF